MAHITREGELKGKVMEEESKWKAAVKRKSSMLDDVRTPYSSFARTISLHICVQMHKEFSNLSKKYNVLVHRVTNCDSLLDETHNWAIAKVSSLPRTRHTSYQICLVQHQDTDDKKQIATFKLCHALLEKVNESGEVVTRSEATSLLNLPSRIHGASDGRKAIPRDPVKRFNECLDGCYCPRKARRLAVGN